MVGETLIRWYLKILSQFLFVQLASLGVSVFFHSFFVTPALIVV